MTQNHDTAGTSCQGKRLDWLLVMIWSFRIIVGTIFILSGVSKLIDLWGTVFKIEDYLDVWSVDIPRTIVFVGSMGLGMYETVSGLSLMLGCYRRFVPVVLTVVMLFMLLLTAYIWINNPVDDCGCFGDFIILSNSATFWKNVVLIAMIIVLLRYNRRAGTVFRPAAQWFVPVIGSLYCIVIGLIGYNIQPLIDFRPYKVGTPLMSSVMTDDEVKFVYEKGGVTQIFGQDELPDEDDGWVFVDRVEDDVEPGVETLSVFDPHTGDDVTFEYLADADELLLLVIPEPARADLSNTYIINELTDAVMNDDGRVVALLATGERGIDRWRDHSMAIYPCLSADDTQLKQLSRGVMSMVWVRNDTIRWKRTVASINMDDVEQISNDMSEIDSLEINGPVLMFRLSYVSVIILIVIYLVQAGWWDKIITRIRRKVHH